ncbi:MAG: hypothetical protein WCG91_04305 [Candidatus Shapirobacteria bacterium]
MFEVVSKNGKTVTVYAVQEKPEHFCSFPTTYFLVFSKRNGWEWKEAEKYKPTSVKEETNVMDVVMKEQSYNVTEIIQD